MIAVESVELEKRYGRVRALAGVSLSVPAGTLWLVSGPNGAGKSTLLRVLGGLTRPTRGRVRVLGADPFRRESAASRGRVGYLGQEPGLYGELSLRENLEFCSRLHALPPERSKDLVAELGLEAVLDQRLRTLSQGYRRRAGLVRALLTAPEILLLDEPWNGLDDAAAQALDERLRHYRDEGYTALVAAHDVERARTLFDAELHLSDGARVGLQARTRT